MIPKLEWALEEEHVVARSRFRREENVMDDRDSERPRYAAGFVAAAFAVSGVAHLLRPGLFIPMVPRSLPAPRALIYVSGAAELVCAAGLSRHARWAPLASTALLLAVWPANVRMALEASERGEGRWKAAVAWARVPVQLPLIWAVLREHKR